MEGDGGFGGVIESGAAYLVTSRRLSPEKQR